MVDLAACYFCGAALDDTLSEVPILPESLREAGTDSPTVTLCPSCEEKLGKVTEAVAAAVEGEHASDVSSTASDADSSASSTGSPAGDDSRDPLEPGADDLVDPETGGGSSAASDSGGPATADSESAAGDAETEPDPAHESDASEADNSGDSGERSVVEGDHSISALEYNKVMRLLQNREFPVDREEIVTVAASAYQVSRQDCDRVIEVAIDRGLIGESEGQLVEPE